MSEFSGRTALVTGAASGIGAACARWLDARGIGKLVLVDRDGGGLAGLDLRCACDRVVGDVSDEALWDSLENEIASLGFAVLNAGVAAGGMIADTSFGEWRKAIGVNLDGMFLSLRTAFRRIGDGGAMVLTASVAGLKAEPGGAAYGASKAGVIQLAKAAAKEGAARNIRVNAIAPGGVDTPIWDPLPFFQGLVAQHHGDRDAAIRAMAKISTPLGRYATADEIAAQIGFLLSDPAATITGAVLVSDGGYSL
jgi:NAD(P)-dependent dehydrogenase (short-subunit alcohol dehydrogenase family)